jgi:hypothetical protein
VTATPRRKQTSAEVFELIVRALSEMAFDDEAPRTKREIERRTNLSHDAVARAFRQDAGEHNQWGITVGLKELRGEIDEGLSPSRQQEKASAAKIQELQEKVGELNRTLDAYAMTLFALQLEDHGLHPENNDELKNRKSSSLGKNRFRLGR